MSVMTGMSPTRAAFGGMNVVWEEILPLGRPLSLAAGAVFRPAERQEEAFYYLAKGEMALIQAQENGREQRIFHLYPGMLLNEVYVLGQLSAPFPGVDCFYSCLADAEFYEFPGRLLHDEAFVSGHPRLIINLLYTLCFKILFMHTTLSNVRSGDAVTRYCRFCLQIAEANGGASEFSAATSRAQTAELLGLHATSLFRAIQKLQKQGILGEVSRDRVEIMDMDALKRIAFGQ